MHTGDDVERAERVALAAYAGLAEDVARVGSATVLRVPQAPESPMLNRAVGLGVEAPATEAEVDAIAARMSGLRHFVAVAPDATPQALPTWLAARGYQPDWGWMLFTRGVDALEARETSLEVVPIDRANAADFARVINEAYGLPAEAAPLWQAVHDAPGWHGLLAVDGDHAVSTAALFVQDGVGYLSLAATRADQRGRGGQGALFAARVRLARELGCDLLATETGERRPDRPSSSYRNILRAGFRERRVVANWVKQ